MLVPQKRSMAKPVIIAGFHFPTKGAAKQFYGEIRDRYPDGVRLLPEDELVLRELLSNHPDAPQKIGVGVAYFTVNTDAHFGRTRHFTVHRVDGSPAKFSYHSCIDGPNARRDRLGALREAVANQILSFREHAFKAGIVLACPLRGVPITRDAYHVDHVPPLVFEVLVQDWLKSVGLTLEQIQITAPTDNQILAGMTEVAQKVSWQEYHRLHARLRMLSPRANLSEARRQ